MPPVTCLEAARLTWLAASAPARQCSCSVCAKRRHSIVDDGSWYFAQNYKAQGGMEKEVDFGIDEALTA